MIFRCIAALSALFGLVSGFRGGLWRGLGVLGVAFLGLTVLALLILGVLCALVDTSKPQEEDSKFYRAVMYPYIEMLMQMVLVKVTATGLEKTPAQGRFLLVCNHQQQADPGVLLHCFPKSQLAFISKQENMRLPVVGKFMHKILCQMIDRDNDRQALRVILKCIQLIKEDKVSIGVFPEGYTSKDGHLQPFRSGVFKIAQKAEVPIVVCTIRGTRDIFPNLKRLKRTHVELRLLEVIPAAELKSKTAVEIGERVHGLMAADLEPELVA